MNTFVGGTSSVFVRVFWEIVVFFKKQKKLMVDEIRNTVPDFAILQEECSEICKNGTRNSVVYKLRELRHQNITTISLEPRNTRNARIELKAYFP
jgi:hypothetical protein